MLKIIYNDVLGIINELKHLEVGRMFQLKSTNVECVEETFLKVFLVTSCCDKPAQSLVQCLPEPTAKFGCGRCEIKGRDISVAQHYFFLFRGNKI